MSAGGPGWVLELDEGRWQGGPPPGPLRMQVVGLFRRCIPGFVIVSGWRRLEDREPVFCRVAVPAELVVLPGEARSRRNSRWAP